MFHSFTLTDFHFINNKIILMYIQWYIVQCFNTYVGTLTKEQIFHVLICPKGTDSSQTHTQNMHDCSQMKLSNPWVHWSMVTGSIGNV